MPPRPKENVWNYPRPPALQPTAARLRVIWVTPSKQELVIADTTQGYRVLETSHPPTYYFPPSSVNMDLIKASKARRTMCEWKGMAAYHDVQFSKDQGPVVLGRIWSYPQPTPSFSKIKDYLCFYASSQTDGERLGRWKCMVDDDEVHAQEGDFYGSWITPEITGGERGFKGGKYSPVGTCGILGGQESELSGRQGKGQLRADHAHAPEASTSSAPRDPSAAYKNMTFDEALEDMSSRFIVNLPSDELSSIERICFQVEQAHWFYEDFLRPLNPALSSLGLRRFSSYLLHTASMIVPLIQQYITGGSGQQDLEAAFDDFMKYKTRVPVCGAILLTEDWKKCLLVKGWKSSASWGFPKGKINQDEPERDCAIREVLEETGFDCGSLLPEDSTDYLDLTMREQKIRLYIVPNVKESTKFETLTRKEISKIAWFKLSDLPTWKKSKDPPAGLGGKFYLISPFIGRLKQWVQANRHTHDSVTDNTATVEHDTTSAAEKYDVYADTATPTKASTAASAMPSFVDGSSFFPSSSSDLRSAQKKANPLPAPPSSDHLKALLGLSSQAAQPFAIPAQQAQGDRAGQPTADERGQQLLSLLSNSTPGGGTPSGDKKQQAASLLSTLNGSQRDPARNHEVSQGLLDTLNAQARSRSPLPAPIPQKTGQAQKLLQMISKGHDQADAPSSSEPQQQCQQQQAPAQADALLRMLQPTMAPQHPQSHVASPPAQYHHQQQPSSVASPPAQYHQQQQAPSQADSLLRMLQGPSSPPQGSPAMPRPPPQNDLLSILTAGLPTNQSSGNDNMRMPPQHQPQQQPHYGQFPEQQRPYPMNGPFGFPPPPPPHMFPQGMMPFPPQPQYGQMPPRSHPQSPPAQWGYSPINPNIAPYSTGPPA